MKFIHMSDIHLSRPGRLVEGLDPHARLAQALSHMTQHHADASHLVITGDLTHFGEPEAYAAVRDALEGFPIPVRLMMGNHDKRAPFVQAFPDVPQAPQGFVHYAEDLPAGRFVYCDTTEPETHQGHFCEARVAWLDQQLAGAETAFVFFHHNPLHLGDPATDELSIRDQDQPALHAVLKRHKSTVRHLFFGHVHEPLCGTLAGIPFSGVPSTMHQVIPDLNSASLSGSAPLEPSYRVVLLRGEDIVIHQIPFAYDGEIIWHGNGFDDWA
ncbi:MAG: phosphodiesterase [Pelagimonas sp.]|jgi:3',5'-cyclic AMP phosphodiesterase CpdA|nr:phosphodiesterase [Pelagimonas sp.]